MLAAGKRFSASFCNKQSAFGPQKTIFSESVWCLSILGALNCVFIIIIKKIDAWPARRIRENLKCGSLSACKINSGIRPGLKNERKEYSLFIQTHNIPTKCDHTHIILSFTHNVQLFFHGC